MTAVAEPAPAPAAAAPTDTRRPRRVPRAGWMVVGSKEFGDHLLSARFIVLVIVLGLAAAIPLYFAAASIRDVASTVTDAQAIFIALFWLAPDVGEGGFALPSVAAFLAYVAPLLGLAFAFDAINGERAEGTLPRLLSQPIHRDDVINGKFVGGPGGHRHRARRGRRRDRGLRAHPAGHRPGRVRGPAHRAVAAAHVHLRVAVAGLRDAPVGRRAACRDVGPHRLRDVAPADVLRRADRVAHRWRSWRPVTGTAEEQLSSIGAQETLRRFLPDTLYREASLSLLNPQVTTVSTPATIGGIEQAQQRIPSLLSLDQSFILVWPQVVGLVALTVACFALAYVMFMRQEVRA